MPDFKQQELRVSIDLYPADVLQIIVSKAGVSNLTKILSSKEFLKQNKNLKYAIDETIVKNKYTFNNESMKPDKMIYWNPPRKKNSTDFNRAREFKAFDDYCVAESIVVEVKLRYKVEFAPDLIELVDLLRSLKPVETVKLSLSMNFVNSHLYFVDLAQLFASMTHLKDRIIAFSISATCMTNFKGEIDLEQLVEVERLKISGCKVSGSFSKLHRLKELSFAPVDGYESLLDIQKLPLSLKSLDFTDCDGIIESISNEGGEFPRLNHISICCFEEPLPTSVKDVIRLMTGPDTKSIEYSFESDGCVDDFVLLVSDVSKEKGFNLKELTVEGHLSRLFDIYPSELLEILYADSEEVTSVLKLPNTLKRFSMADDYGLNAREVLRIIPTGLEYLRLTNNGGDWDNVDTDFSKFTRLKYLNLSRTGIKDFDFVFPCMLEELDLSGNEIETIDSAEFPKSLRNLILSFNEIKEVSGSKLPVTLERLNMLGNPIEKVDLLIGECFELLQVETLYIGCKSSSKVSYKLPSTLQSLYFNCCNTLSHDFGENLVSIRLESCQFAVSSGELFKQQSKLRYLGISHCQLADVSINYPQSLEEIDLSFNDFSEVPQQLGYLENLRYLQFSNNNVQLAIIEFHQSALEVLDLSYNVIEETHLSFPEGLTKLKQLDLSQNELKDITIENIGHNNKSFHSSLYELNLAYNELSEEKIEALISRLPDSTQSLRADSNTGGILRAINYLSS